MPKSFESKTGIAAKCDDDNMQIPNSHFHSLFNSEIEVDLPLYDIAHELDATPTHTNITNGITSIVYDKAPGQSKLIMDMIKNVPPSALFLH
jgi:hypothetical protein